ncbi:MAG TPA: hypothetical protein VJI46_00145 [Candidatus Nanoarchaeia archaeon]|nr:hypothetical protein [Candidatus Nanoarchaeia archaeon]
MAKTLFKNGKGEIHFGVNAPEGFVSAGKSDAEKSLSKLGKMKLWRCSVCNDMHIGLKPPHECPTCHQIESYVEINEKEFRVVIG